MATLQNVLIQFQKLILAFKSGKLLQTEAPMDEKRKLDRKYLIVYSRVFERNLGKMLGYLGDLSLSGAMIISEQPQTVNSVLPLRFDLPDLQLFNIGQLDITARVAHCDPDINPAFYNIGFEFLDVTPEQKKRHRKDDGRVRIPPRDSQLPCASLCFAKS